MNLLMYKLYKACLQAKGVYKALRATGTHKELPGYERCLFYLNGVIVEYQEREVEGRNEEEHRQYHVETHKLLDELVDDFMFHTNKFPSKTTILELLGWSCEQTIKPATK